MRTIPRSMWRPEAGFSLIELMITVVIVGILAAVAYPMYQDAVFKGRRGEARAAIMEAMQQQERYMTQRNCYLAFQSNGTRGTAVPPWPSTVCGGVTASSVPFKAFSGANAQQSYYDIYATTCNDLPSGRAGIHECVQVHARPRSPDPEVGELSLTSTGARACTGTARDRDFKKCWP